MMAPTALLLVPLLLFNSPRAARSLKDLRLLRADQTEIEFSYESPPLRVSPFTVDGNTQHMVTINGCSYTEETGKPQVPVRLVHLGIPLGSKIGVSVLAAEDSLLGGLMVSPVPEIVGDSVPSYRYRVDHGFYSQDRVYPREAVEVVEVGMLRNQPVVRLRISPCQYNPKRRRMTWHKRLRVRVAFSSPATGRGPAPSETDALEGVYKDVLLNYEQAKSFRQPRSPRVLSYVDQAPWYKISTVEEGLYKMTSHDLEEAGIGVEGLDPRTFRLYNGGSAVLPYQVTALKHDTIPYQVPIYVYGEEDGSFDSEDYVLFYGVSLDGWGKNIIPGWPSGDFSLYYNPYTDTNCYWLTWGGGSGSRMATRDGSLVHPNPYRPSTFETVIHLEESKSSPLQSGYGWVWDSDLLRHTQQAFTRDYPAEIQGTAEGDTSTTDFALYGADTMDPLIHAVRILVNGEVYSDTVWTGSDNNRVHVHGSGLSLKTGLNTFTIELYAAPGDASEDLVYLDYFEVRYRKKYEAHTKKLKLSTSGNPSDTTYEFTIKNLGEGSIVVDVTDPFEPVRIAGPGVSPNEVKFQDSVDTTQAYFAAGEFLSPLEIARSSWHTLRDYPGADWVAICYDGFTGGLSPLVEWRNDRLLGVPNPQARVVSLSEVYDNFSWGLPDPTAIRDFLKYAFENWNPAPGWCFLVGAGTYDYKNFTGLSHPKNFLPPYETGHYVVGDATLPLYNYSYDDWFVWLTDDYLQDMALGRTTVTSSQETRRISDKVVEYESKNLGAWRNRILFIADDEFAGGFANETFHARDTETLSRIVPHDVDVLKVYLMEYEGVGEPMTKPGATDDIIKYMDQGVLAGSFLGHGSFRRLTHETVFYNPRDINALNNEGRQPFFYYGSCGVGRFDLELENSIADFMQKSNGRGAIATLAATRVTGAGGNFSLGSQLLNQLLGDTAVTIGSAVLTAKSNASPKSLYVLFGDPATNFALPDLHVGLEVTPPDTLRGGTKVTIRGKVVPPFNGYACIAAFESVDSVLYTTGSGETVDYVLPGSPIYRSMTRIENGRFSQGFTVPLDLEEGTMGRVSCYAWGASQTGHGAVDSLICGIDDTTFTDSLGPELMLLADGKPLTDSSYILPNSSLQGICSDESGINITSQDGVSMTLVIDGDTRNPVSLYNYFTYDFESYTKGAFSYPLPFLDPNVPHTFLIRVSDNLKNVTMRTVVLNISSQEDIELENVMNYPNPFSKKTWFSFNLNQTARVAVKIYTIRGRLIKVVEDHNCKPGFNTIPWDGFDEDGDPVANGVYLYKVIAKAEQAISGVEAPREMRSEKFEKLIVVR